MLEELELELLANAAFKAAAVSLWWDTVLCGLAPVPGMLLVSYSSSSSIIIGDADFDFPFPLDFVFGLAFAFPFPLPLACSGPVE